MSIFNRPERREAFWADEVAEVWAARRSGGWAGVSVTPESVLKIPAVFSCVQLTAGTISQLPFDEHLDEYGHSTSRKVAAGPLVTSPSAEVTPEDWRFQAVESAQLHGNAVGVVAARDRRMYPTQIELVHPKLVQVRFDKSTRALTWRVDGQVVDRGDVWHMTGRPSLGSPLGVGLVEFMATVAGSGLAARRYSADWFGSGGAPVVVARPSTDPGEEGAERLKAKIMQAIRSRSPLILPKSIEQESWQGSAPSDAQLVEMLRQNATDLAQFFVVPPELVGGRTGDSMTYSNTEHRLIDLLTFGVTFWLNKLEKSMTRALPRGRWVSADEQAIVRTDIATRIKNVSEQVRGGFMTTNEARAEFGRPASDMGDRLLWPPHTVQVQTMAEDALTSDTPRE